MSHKPNYAEWFAHHFRVVPPVKSDVTRAAVKVNYARLQQPSSAPVTGKGHIHTMQCEKRSEDEAREAPGFEGLQYRAYHLSE